MSTITASSRISGPGQVGWRQRVDRWLGSEWFTAYTFLLIPLLLFIAIKFYPVFYNLFLSFTNYDLFSPMKFVGVANYQWTFSSEVTLKAIRNTVLFTLGTVPIGTALALLIAVLLDQPIRGRIVFRTIYYLPVVTSVVVSALVWKWIFNPQLGILNYALGLVGIPGQQWLYDPRLALPSLIIVSLWSGLGANMVIFLAGLQDVPEELYEAARIDGAKSWQIFAFITVPMLRPVTLFVVVTYTIAIFRSFGLIFILTQGGPLLTTNTLVWEVYMNAFGYLRLGRAGAISMVLLLTILLITIVNFRLLREEE
jgi:multiple sugar transport system permease protein